MELSENTHKLATQILKYFDPALLKEQELAKLSKAKATVKGDKWDKIVKMDEIEDDQQKVNDTEYSKEQQEYMAKLIGCSKDHGKEIDLYNKPYEEKIDRVLAHV
jgi:hypothetical protein